MIPNEFELKIGCLTNTIENKPGILEKRSFTNFYTIQSTKITRPLKWKDIINVKCKSCNCEIPIKVFSRKFLVWRRIVAFSITLILLIICIMRKSFDEQYVIGFLAVVSFVITLKFVFDNKGCRIRSSDLDYHNIMGKDGSPQLPWFGETPFT